MKIEILVKDIMSSQVLKVAPSDGVFEVISKMKAKNVGSAIVIGKNEVPIGIVTERDIAFKVSGEKRDPEKTTCSEIMTGPIFCIESSADITQAAGIMSKNNFRRLPVVEGGKLVGIVTEKDLAEIQPDVTRLLQGLLNTKEGPGNDQISKYYHEKKAKEEFERIKSKKRDKI